MTAQFVQMHHPQIPSTATDPILVSPQSVDDHMARGWVLVDPEAEVPPSSVPYVTQAAGDSRYVRDTELGAQSAALVTAGTGELPDALRAAFGALGSVEAVVTHDGTAGGGTRPTGYARVRWVGGTTRPTNMATGDVWEYDA